MTQDDSGVIQFFSRVLKGLNIISFETMVYLHLESMRQVTETDRLRVNYGKYRKNARRNPKGAIS